MFIHRSVFIVGSAFIFAALSSAIRTFVVPRAIAPGLTRSAFALMHYIFELPFHQTYQLRRERALAYYAPVTA